MNQLQQLYTSLSARQRWAVALVTVLVAVGTVGFARWQRDRSFRPLYTALAPEDAASVVQKLRESNVEYHLADNGTSVLVDSSRIAELRLELASAGVPKSGRIGFELFDKTNFGMTEFTEHVNYQRALEGELERSVMSLSEVEQARVHLTFPKESVFTESREPAKASVMLRLRSGARLAPQNVASISHLVASAVEGLSPDGVSVLDMRGNLLSRPRPRNVADGAQESEATLEYRQQIERDMAGKINATLTPLLGAEKFRVAVSVDCDLTSGEQNEETFDPSKSVMVTSQRTEDQPGSSSVAGGQPGVASNLPRPPDTAAMRNTGAVHRTEQITYQTSRTVRKTKIPQGIVKHVSAAVLLDQAVRWEGVGAKARRVLMPPAPETVKTIHGLVSAAIGLSPDRGDQLIVESLPFESTTNSEPPAEVKPQQPAPQSKNLNFKEPRVLYPAIGGAVLLFIAVTWVALRKRRRRTLVMESPPSELPSPENAPSGMGQQSALAEIAGQSAALGNGADLARIGSSRSDDLVRTFRTSAAKEAPLYAGVIRGWLNEKENA